MASAEDIVHELDRWSRTHGVAVYIDRKPLQEVTGRAVSVIADLRLSLSQSQHEAERAKAELARLQSELAGVRERVEKMERALRTIRSDCGTLSPQEFCNVCTDGLGLARAPYEGAADPNESCITLTSKIRDMRDRAVAASLSSRPLAPAEVSRG